MNNNTTCQLINNDTKELNLHKIQWTGITWNTVTGCTFFGKECLHCYAKVETERKKHNPNQPKYAKGFDEVVEHPMTLLIPFTWKEPQTVFVNSMSDIFHKDVSFDFIKRVFEVMNNTPEHTYQVLTKRNHLLEEYSDKLNWTDNIWMGVSCGVKSSTRRLESLRKCGAKHKFVSIEPLIEEITDIDFTGIDWVIVGGESGSNAVRPMEKQWVYNIKEKCDEAKVPFFFKQWGKTRNNPNQNDPTINRNHTYGAKGGCMLDGRLYLANPTMKDDLVPTINLFDEDYFVMDIKNGLNTIWELKSYLPMMEKDLYSQLKEDIKHNGMNDPILYITTQDGRKLVVDGHTRLSIASDLKLKEILTKEITDVFENLDEIKLWMIKHQFKKRNLSNIEKIQLAMQSKETIERIAKANLIKAGKGEEIETTIDTNEEIARIAGVGRTTVVRFSSVINKGSNTLIEKMKNAEISIAYAYKAIKDKQEKISKPKIEKPIQYTLLESVDEGKEKVAAGLINYFVVVDEIKLVEIKNRINKKVGVYFLSRSNDISLCLTEQTQPNIEIEETGLEVEYDFLENAVIEVAA